MKGVRYTVDELKRDSYHDLEKRIRNFARGNSQMLQELEFYLRLAQQNARDGAMPYKHVLIRQNGVFVIGRDDNPKGGNIGYSRLYL